MRRFRHILAVNDARKAYYKAAEAAHLEGLHPTHPVRLGVALNTAVFRKKVLHDPAGASRMAMATYDAAVTLLHELPEEFYKESLDILGQLKDNAQVWAGEESEAVRLQKVVQARTEKLERRRRVAGGPPQPNDGKSKGKGKGG